MRARPPVNEDPSFQSESKPGRGRPGVSRFVEHLLNHGIVTEEMLEDALLFKQTKKSDEKRPLFLTFIDEFGLDRELIYAEFTRYYSFNTVSLANTQMNKEALSFIGRTLDALPEKSRESATTNKLLPWKVLPGEQPKLQLITPDPTNPEISVIAKSFPYPKFELA